jgi:hypothetical protein
MCCAAQPTPDEEMPGLDDALLLFEHARSSLAIDGFQ